jgi:hypothetical protein
VRHADASELAQVDHLVRVLQGEVPARIVTAAARTPGRGDIGDREPNAGREFVDFCRQLIG